MNATRAVSSFGVFWNLIGLYCRRKGAKGPLVRLLRKSGHQGSLILVMNNFYSVFMKKKMKIYN